MNDKETDEPPSVNIIFTTACPGRCKYCFAPFSNAIVNPGSRFISADSLATVLGFLKQSGVRSVRVLGGEPLVHPEFGRLIQQIQQDSYFNQIVVFTSGLFEPALIRYLTDSRVVVVVNTNHPRDYTPQAYRRFVSVVEQMADQGVKFSLGFNIYERNFEWSPLLSLCLMQGVNSVRLALACPTISWRNSHLEMRDQKRLGSRICEMVSAFVAERIGVKFDCVAPPCIFTDAEWGYLMKHVPGGQERAFVCNPCLDIDPDLNVVRCFAVNEPTAHLTNFSTTRDLFTFFYQQVDIYKWHATREDCADCEHRQTGKCQGGCVAFSWPEIARLRQAKEPAAALFESAYTLLRSQRYEAAVDRFMEGLKIYPIDGRVVCDYVYSLLKCSRLEQAEDALRVHARTLQIENRGAECFLRGLILESRSQYQLAAASYRRALRYVSLDKRAEIMDRLTKVCSLDAGASDLVNP